MGNLPETISGFAVLPAVYSKDATHILYAKIHTAQKKTTDRPVSDVLPKERTLFLVNIPPDATERELSLFFKPDGLVEKVVFDQRAAEEEALNAIDESESEAEEPNDESMDVDEERPVKRAKKVKDKNQRPTLVSLPPSSLRTFRRTGRTAFVVFLDSSSLSKALSPPHTPRPWPQSTEHRGLLHYKTLHSAMRPPLDVVRTHAESAIALYDYEEQQRKKKCQYRKGEAIVDEDGFTLVTRGGAYGQTLGGGVAIASKRFQVTGETSERVKGKKKKKQGMEKEGFYAFQKHEKKRQELIDLKKKWQEDLEKVQKLKESKRYKPY
ncbi:uncharacterized protein FOMMEDRAFT_90179 [Fomitiporia mediterranea MF3/22]|uniref:uncharacterized protein n=1 Tax=Fomitiporia mediterranea (strain MF3/22) TaxID=694068 RepID=UPI0004407B86|nr:uncharacterized protein FOMMEDRAFT_90179 [Fomitiporia mediterranea MF3/22]EJD01681.1 hypothetical protein FOMMEDRAFT_90179 [Fomitiporia mediterranea MF3/22]